MQWIQTKFDNQDYQRFRRFKCNQCGTTTMVPCDTSDTLPSGWSLGLQENSHLCAACGIRPIKRAVLPILH